MIKRFILSVLMLTAIASLVGCGGKSSTVTMDDYVSVFKEKGIEVDKENEPFYSMIGASNGITFTYKDKAVIYEYGSEKDLEKAKKDNEFAKDWVSNGRFLLETNNEDIIEIFNSVK